MEMTAVQIIDPGEHATLEVTRRPVPEPGNGEVLIKVHAAGINRPDIIQKQGHYDPPPGVSDLPGLEVAGIIEETGDAVCALIAGGGYAEYCVVPESQCLPVPRGLTLAEAAGIPETFFTVWRNLFDIGGFKDGDSVLVHGGSSGIGTTAIQLIKAFGGRVYVTAGTEEKCDACEKLGADIAINYTTQDFVEEIARATDGAGVDIVLDMVGGDYLARNQNCMGEGARHVSIAFQQGRNGSFDISTAMRKRHVFTGSVLRPRPVDEKAAIASRLQEHVWPLLETGQIKPVICKTFPLESAAEAQALMEDGSHIGKIILTVTPEATEL